MSLSDVTDTAIKSAISIVVLKETAKVIRGKSKTKKREKKSKKRKKK